MADEHFDPDYLVTMDEIFHAHWSAEKRARIALLRRALAQLWPAGHPTKFLIIAGTSGKGSVTHYLAQGLRVHGKTGSWTGPHLFDYAERIHINGEIVDHASIVGVYRERVRALQDQFTREQTSLSFEELGILISLCLFEQQQVQWGLMEVFCGGRYSPLMALPMVACLLTNVGEDHLETLGKHSWQRALEKAGIAQPGVPFFTAAEGETLAYVLRTANAARAPVTVVDGERCAQVSALVPEPLPQHVLSNLSLAVTAVRHLLPDLQIGELLACMKARLPARFWLKEANVVVDVAHNPNKIDRLAQELKAAFPWAKFVFVLGLTHRRDPRTVFAPILAMAQRIVLTTASHAGQDPHGLMEVLREVHCEISVELDPMVAFEGARTSLAEGEVLVLTGSTYTVDQALNPNRFLRENNATYGRRYRQPGR